MQGTLLDKKILPTKVYGLTDEEIAIIENR